MAPFLSINGPEDEASVLTEADPRPGGSWSEVVARKLRPPELPL